MTSLDPTFVNQLMKGIQQELQLFQQLEQLLAAECSALKQREASSLTELLKLKSSALSQVEAQVRYRLQLFSERGMNSDEASLTSIFDQLPGKQKKLAHQLWKNVNDSIENCHKKNEINARITHKNQQSNADMIEILRGSADKTGLYNPAGKRSSQYSENPRPAATA